MLSRVSHGGFAKNVLLVPLLQELWNITVFLVKINNLDFEIANSVIIILHIIYVIYLFIFLFCFRFLLTKALL